MTGRGHLTRSARWKLDLPCRGRRWGVEGAVTETAGLNANHNTVPGAGTEALEQRGLRKGGGQNKSSLTRVTEESWSPHEGKVRIQIRKSGALKLAEERVRHDPSSQGTEWGKQLYQHHLSTQMSRPKTKMLPGQHVFEGGYRDTVEHTCERQKLVWRVHSRSPQLCITTYCCPEERTSLLSLSISLN